MMPAFYLEISDGRTAQLAHPQPGERQQPDDRCASRPVAVGGPDKPENFVAIEPDDGRLLAHSWTSYVTHRINGDHLLALCPPVEAAYRAQPAPDRRRGEAASHRQVPAVRLDAAARGGER